MKPFRLHIVTAVIALFWVSSVTAQVLPRNVGYRSAVNVSDLPTIEFEPSPSDSRNDTGRLQRAIDEASSTVSSGPGGQRNQGAVIRFARGSYLLRSVELKSDVYIRFRRGVVLNYDADIQASGREMFYLRGGVENVSIVGNRAMRVQINGPRRSADPFEGLSFRAFALQDVDNFEIRNVRVNNRGSRNATMICFAEDRDRAGTSPTQGSIVNFSSINEHRGFGTIQAHSARRVLFQNIVGNTSAVALRFETGIASADGLRDIEAINIRQSNGRAAVLIGPHASITHNRVRIRRIVATNCSFAVDFRAGFVRDRDTANGFPETGRFNNLVLSDITANYGDGDDAQPRVRPDVFRLFPTSLLPEIPADFMERFLSGDKLLSSSPVGAVFSDANYDFFLDVSTVSTNGFPPVLRRPLISDEDTPSRNSEEASIRDLVRTFNRMRLTLEDMFR